MYNYWMCEAVNASTGCSHKMIFKYRTSDEDLAYEFCEVHITFPISNFVFLGHLLDSELKSKLDEGYSAQNFTTANL